MNKCLPNSLYLPKLINSTEYKFECCKQQIVQRISSRMYFPPFQYSYHKKSHLDYISA